MRAHSLIFVLIKNICVRLCVCVAVWCKEFPVQCSVLSSKGCLTPFLGYFNYLFGKNEAGSSWEICLPKHPTVIQILKHLRLDLKDFHISARMCLNVLLNQSPYPSPAMREGRID